MRPMTSADSPVLSLSPLVQAPMAGGPGTPELAAAVSSAGGLGFLAAGYLSADAMLGQLDRAEALTDHPLGVNLFVPERTPDGRLRRLADADLKRLSRYRERLAAELPAASDGDGRTPAGPAPLDTAARPDDDDYPAKLAALVARPAPPAVVSFTFGLPTAAELAALRHRGVVTVATVTSEEEALAAVRLGLGGLCVQGPEAGGHRGTHQCAQTPDPRPLTRLLPDVVAAVRGTEPAAGARRVWIAAAGGIATPGDVARVLRAGADAAQAGSAFLLCREAGTGAAHRSALRALGAPEDGPEGDGGTAVTRAFTGRPARGIANDFLRRHSEAAPALYPAVHHLTRPIRAEAAASGDRERLHLWAGTRAGLAREATAAEITAELLTGTSIASDITGE
ncbi:nitronate monooxygenase [Zhihengliuella sp.]|uniref:NAD(P)H-dependent flavin oxidoreductase n=1 Tax=Zhihengliuella sp. TaxID=1954483 RepID=UPI002811AFE7|nr:nitronate monooxygenase [Zhihengliuella sp.]